MFAEIENLLYLKRYEPAEEKLKIAENRYANEADVYRLYGELYYDKKDYAGLKKMIEKVKSEHIYLDRESREWLRFWDESEQQRILG